MVVVMSLSTYESTRGRYDRGIIHLSGLHRMIEMQGGLGRVGLEKPEIMQKIYRYVINREIIVKIRALAEAI